MSLDRKRWAIIAADLKFSQLDVARKQAEAWRTGLAALTALLTAILVLKGQDNVSALTEPSRTLVVVLLGLALFLLLAATMLVSRALAGPPGEEILLTGEGLEDWTRHEVKKISTAIGWAPWLAVAGIVAIAAAVGVTWLAPARDTSVPLVQVTERNGQTCGEFIGVARQQVILRSGSGSTLIPIPAVVSIAPVNSCG